MKSTVYFISNYEFSRKYRYYAHDVTAFSKDRNIWAVLVNAYNITPVNERFLNIVED